jgi:hypothetical protein
MGWREHDWSRREVFGAAIVTAVTVLGWLVFGVDLFAPDEDRSVEAIQACITAAASGGYPVEPSGVFSSGSANDYEVTLQFGEQEVACAAHHSGSGWTAYLPPR